MIGVTICGEDCTKWATWVTSTKITCQTGVEGGWGEVIVTTRSGGRGTCTVHFRGISPLRDGKPSNYFLSHDSKLLLNPLL